MPSYLAGALQKSARALGSLESISYLPPVAVGSTREDLGVVVLRISKDLVLVEEDRFVSPLLFSQQGVADWFFRYSKSSLCPEADSKD